MILDRSHRQWLLLTLVVLGIGSVSYAVYASGPTGVSGGSLPGLVFGLVGTAMMIFAGLLSARRQVPTWRIGSAQFWLKGHIWLGLLSVAFILFHAGFRWGGPVEIGLWLTTAVIILSGVVGLAFQQVLPRLVTTRVPNETFIDQVPYQCASMQFLADKLISEISSKLDTSANAAINVAEDVARQRKWLKRDGDLQKIVAAIYENPPQLAPDAADKPAPAPAAKAQDKPAAKSSSVLEQARKQGSDGVDKPAGKPAAKPSSVLEQARKQGSGGAGKPAGKKPSAKGASVLEQARAQQAAPAEGGGEESAKPDEKPAKSVLEMARGQAAAPARKPAKTSKSPGGPVKAARPVTQKSLPKEERPAPKPASEERKVIRTDELKTFYLKTVRPFLGLSSSHNAPLSRADRRRAAFRKMRADLPSELHQPLDQLEEFCDRRGQLHRLTTIHRWLHGWLYLHVPVSAALLILFVAHVVMSLRVVPWEW